MIIARAPVRISFGGGGTDLESFYRQNGGVVVSTTIDKYFYCLISDAPRDQLQLISADYRSVINLEAGNPDWKGELALPRAIIHEYNLNPGHTIFLASEVPPGTGLGSSSAVAVAMIRAMSELTGRPLTTSQLAEKASLIEIEKLAMPIGKQDQYASAFGGLNVYEFSSDGVAVRPLRIRPRDRQRLEENTMLFFTGTTHDAASILKQQNSSTVANDQVVVGALHEIKDIAFQIVECLESGNMRRYADLLDESWLRKKRLATDISNSFIDDAYETALTKGARGGKITGAGGGGFLMLYCEKRAQPAVRQAMQRRGLVPMDFGFTSAGAEVLVNSRTFAPDAMNYLKESGFAFRTA